MTTIKFGTSGWRAIIGDEFTYQNVRIVSQAIADYIKTKEDPQKGVVIGYDSRFMSEKFATITAEIMAGNGVPAYLCQRSTPTPTIAFEILRRDAAGGINFTASHNPPEYNGIKFSPSWGGPALPETTKQIEETANTLIKHPKFQSMEIDDAKVKGLIEEIDPKDDYFAEIMKKINFDAIREAKLKVVADPLYGAGRGYLSALLKKAGCDVSVVHDFRDVYFGGNAPEPAVDNLKELYTHMRDHSFHLGLAVDGDADRFGVVDRGGIFINPNSLIAMALDHLIKTRGWDKGVARSVATTQLIDKVAQKHGVPVHETPVGFKYIGDLIAKDEITIGGEESAGLSIRHHVPEKDGILACLLAAEMVAVSGKSLSQQLEELYAEVGTVLSDRVNVHLSHQKMDAMRDRIKTAPDKVGDLIVKDVITTDGMKLVFDDSRWLLIRLSGTEPVVRLYVEAGNETDLEHLKKIGMNFIEQ